MSRYIDAEWLMNFFVGLPDDYTLTIGNLRAVVNDAPSIEICFDMAKEDHSFCSLAMAKEDHSFCSLAMAIDALNADRKIEQTEREGE